MKDLLKTYVKTQLEIAPDSEKNLFEYQLLSPHHDNRPQKSYISTIVIHYTEENCLDTLNLFLPQKVDKRVSCHYLITQQEDGIESGKIIEIVPTSKRAWHAGQSSWKDENGLNATSIGIENVNPGLKSDGTWQPFCVNQIQALGALCQALIRQYGISPTHIVGHADIAPDRKQDPGPLFPWGKLYHAYGVGAWLSPQEQNPEAIQHQYAPQEPLPKSIDTGFLSTYLKAYGYPLDIPADTEQFENVLKAFQAHFSQNQNPAGVTGKPTSQDMFWVWGLCAKYIVD